MTAYGLYQANLVRQAIESNAKQVERMESRLAEVPPLTESEIDSLRRSLNDEHAAAARALGIEPVLRRQRLVRVARDSGLVQIDATPRYRLLDAEYSVYIGTHGVRRALDSLSALFWADLDALRLPGFRFTVSSMLRSAEDQAAVQGVNINAARGTSSHEHGTTFDITYRRFGYRGGPEPELARLPKGLAPIVRGQTRNYLLEQRETSYRRMASRHTEELSALLGRALIRLENDGVLLALHEQQQPVYHVTALLRDTTVAPPRP